MLHRRHLGCYTFYIGLRLIDAGMYRLCIDDHRKDVGVCEALYRCVQVLYVRLSLLPECLDIQEQLRNASIAR